MTQCYLLDTNVCIALERGRHAILRQRVAARPLGQMCICEVVWAELLLAAELSGDYGRARSRIEEFRHLASYPFDRRAAECHAGIRALLQKEGRTIGANDLLIAAIVLANDLILVTHNTREFSRVPGLRLEDWLI
ncbi:MULTISPECIES: type II toxin-antitoxin system VapC family toxin [Methylococcus]|uniref:Ribonuclease VapC n=1 Tax=Methylococcus capsulatus TaxID=414 RepID=A0ABZ2FA01_METCP|nr:MULTISPECIES: type II toxin-antitoxin system VapC family toxin [Methylococcus]MDF9392779.1 type II toxin-antitoxin system VapC family toxin [Methylococcus capsulatus]